MPRACSVCQHPDVADIDAELVRGISPYQLEARHSALSHDAIRRHKGGGHIPNKLLKAQAVEEVTAADVLLADIATIRAAAFRALDKAEESEDTPNLLRAIREARENVRVLGELHGRLNAGTTVNILIAPQVQALILDALDRYPEARLAVAEALAEIEATQ